MPELCRFNGISFRIHADNLPPHTHVRYSGVDATVEIKGCFITHNRFPPRVSRDIGEWVTLHEDELLKAWDLINGGVNPDKIAPLR